VTTSQGDDEPDPTNAGASQDTSLASGPADTTAATVGTDDGPDRGWIVVVIAGAVASMVIVAVVAGKRASRRRPGPIHPGGDTDDRAAGPG
jgi:hypothetical protein